MSDVNANIGVNIDSSQALAQLKALQRQISEFNLSVAKSNEAAALAQKSLQTNFINSINSIGAVSAELRTVKTTAESFTHALENNKLSMREYFRYAGAATKTFGNSFKSELNTISKTAEERVKTLQTQYIKMGRDANGAMKAIAVRPLVLDMESLATKTQLAAQKQAIFNQLMKQGSTNLLNFGKNTQWAGRQLMVGFTLPLMAFGAAASKSFQQLETEVIKFRKVYGDLGTDSKQTEEALKNIQKLADGYTKYGVEVSKTVALASQAAAAGFQGADLMAQTDAASKLAVLGQIDQQQALQTTISLQNAFKISSQDLAGTIDFLNAVENQTVTSLDDITIAIPKVAPVIESLGGNVKDLAFFLTAMKEGGVNASEGANALKSGLASLINPSKKASDMLASMGINISNIVTKNKGDLKATVIEFAKALDTLDPLARARAIETMFGKFQFARISTLLSNVTQQGNQASRVLDLAGQSASNLAGITEKELGITSASALVKFQAAMAKLKASLAPVGEVFMKAFTPILEFVTKVLDKFNNLSDGTKKVIAIIVGVVGGLGPVLLMTFGLLANGIANIIKLFMTLRNGYQRLTGQSQNLGEQTQYLTSEQLDAAAAAHSLEQSHARLTQQFTVEAGVLAELRMAYQQALAAGAAFAQMNPGMMRTPNVPKFADGTAGIISGPGTGTSDSILARVSNGEAIIPARIVDQNPQLISNLVAGKLPGFVDGLDPNANWIESMASRGSTQARQASIRSYLTGEIQKISSRAGRFQYSETAILSEFKSFIETTTAGLQDITKASLDTALKAQRNILETYSPQTFQGEKNQFAHIGSGINVTAKDLQSSGVIVNPQMRAKLEQLASVLPDKSLGIKSGFGFDILGDLNNQMGKTGANLRDVIESFNTNGIEKWRKTIEIGGGNFDKLSQQVTEYDRRFSSELQRRLDAGATTIVDTEMELKAAQAKIEAAGGTFNKNLYVVVEEVDTQVRAGLGQFGRELNGVITQAINTITEVRVNLTAQEDAMLGGSFLGTQNGKARLSGRLATGGTSAGRVAGGQGLITPELRQAAITSTNNLIDTISTTAGVASPSKRTIPIGQDIMRGVEVGIETQLPETIATAELAMQEVIAAQEAVLVTQAGRKVKPRRVAASTQGAPENVKMYNPAAAAPPGAKLLPIVPLEKETPEKTSRFAGKGGMITMGAMMLGSMGLSAAPEFAGKSLAQSALNMGSMGAGLGMFFGPEGALIGAGIGAGIGVATSAVSMLMEAEKKHEAVVKSTFTNAAGDITFFGDKILDTTLKLDKLGFSVKGITDKFGFANPEIQAFVKYIEQLPADDPTKIFVENLKTLDKRTAIIGNIRQKVANAIATGGLDPKNAKDYVAGLLTAAGKASMFADVWKNIQLSIRDEANATKTQLDKVFKDSQIWMPDVFNANTWIYKDLGIFKKYKDLNKIQKEYVKTVKDLLGAMTNGSLSADQYAARIAGINKSALNGVSGIQMLRYAIESTGDKKALAGFDALGTSLDALGQKTTANIVKLLTLQNLSITPQQAAAKLGVTYYNNLPIDIKQKQDTQLLLDLANSGKPMKDLLDAQNKAFQEYNKILNGSGGVTSGTKELSAAAKAYLKILDAEIKGLEKKAEAQKSVNDEIQRNIDYQNKQQDLASKIARARMSGDYLTATILQQEIAQNQLTFNNDTAYNKLQAQISDLKVRQEEINNGANLTKAENDKLAKFKVKKANGGMVTHYDDGGGVSGPGTSTSDSIPAMLSDGEYVVKASAVDKYGVPLLHAINSEKLANGGYVQHFGFGSNGPVRAIPSNFISAPIESEIQPIVENLFQGYNSIPGGPIKTKPADKNDNWFKRYVRNQTEGINATNAWLQQSKWTSWMSADPLGAVKFLRKASGTDVNGSWLGMLDLPSNFIGFGLGPKIAQTAKAAQIGSKIAAPFRMMASKLSGPFNFAKKIATLPMTRRAEEVARIAKQEAEAAEQARLAREAAEWVKNNPRPARPGAGAPSQTTSLWDNMDWGNMPDYGSFSAPANTSLFSKVASSPFGKIGKFLARPITTPFYNIKSLSKTATEAWRNGPGRYRWKGDFDKYGRSTLYDEITSRFFGNLGNKFNPKTSIINKIRSLPAALPEGMTTLDPLSFFEKLLLNPERKTMYDTSYKNIVPNLSNDYIKPFIGKVTGKLDKVVAGSKEIGSAYANKTISFADLVTGVTKGLMYKTTSSIKDKTSLFLSLFSDKKKEMLFNNSPIDFSLLRLVGQKAESLHAPELAESLTGNSQYFIKMVTKLSEGKELFGSEWMNKIGLPAPVNRKIFNAPEIKGRADASIDAIHAIASESFIPKGFQTVKNFVEDMTNPNRFDPNSLEEILKRGLVKSRLALDVAQSVIGHGDLHIGNQLIDPKTGQLGMLDFESILSNEYRIGLSNTVDFFKNAGVPQKEIADTLRLSIKKITRIPDNEIIKMMEKSGITDVPYVFKIYKNRLETAKNDIDYLISNRLWFKDYEKAKPKFHNWNGVVPGPYGQELNAVLKSGTEGVYQNSYIAGLKKEAYGNTSTSNSNSVYNIDMTINGGNANANEIADQVIRKLKVVGNQNNKTNKVTW